MLEGYVNTEEAAQMLGVSPSRVRRMISEGEIKGAHQIPPLAHRGVWFIPIEEVERLKVERQEKRQKGGTGRPPKKPDTV